jgi:tricorn protease
MKLALALAASALHAAPGYYRDPALRGDTVVFTAEGDLWRVPAAGGLATRLTSHPGGESQAAISPDGRTVVFLASYDGTPDVYAMPLAGGEPTRLTFEGGRSWVQGFDRAGRVIYATENVIGPTARRVLRTVDLQGRDTRELPLADAREAAFDADGGTLWFTRLGLAVSNDNALDYRGGAMGQVWRWGIGGNEEAQRIATDLDANLTQPMWWNGRLIAVSDAGGRPNLWSMAPDGGDRKPLTAHTDFDVREPSLDGDRIVYQHGADLRLFDLASGEDRLLPIQLGSDYGQRRQRFVAKPMGYLTGAHANAAGKRVALSARGRVALAGTGALRRVDVAAPARARLREAVISHDDRWVYAITDLDGKSEIWRYPADGSPGAKPMTSDGTRHRWRLYPSPDGRFLAHDDKGGRLALLDLQSGESHVVDQSKFAVDDSYSGVAWSADGRLLAFARPDSPRLVDQVVIYDTKTAQHAVVTSDRYESFAPSFSRDGDFLYFLSNRTFQGAPGHPWGDRNTGSIFDKRTKIYALALQPKARFPFLAPDELAPADDANPSERTAKQDDAQPDKKGVKKSNLPDGMVFEGLPQRLFEVPVPAGNYRQLALHADRLYVLERDATAQARGQLKWLAIANDAPKLESFLADVQDFELSADGKKLFVTKAAGDPAAPPVPGDLLLFDAGTKAPEDLSKATVRVADWTLAIDPVDEWRQMFDDAWRMHREFSFDPSMRGQDWNAVRARFEPLLARVNDRAELDDLFAQMMAEHGILHSQIREGELRTDPNAPVAAALGAKLAAADGGVRIERIYRTDPEVPSERSPLQAPGVDARDGDLLIAINGRPVRTPGDVATQLRQQAGQQVLLQLKRGGAAPHRTVAVPVRMDRDAALRYSDWVQGTREKVERAGGGRIGYLHLRAMTAADMAQFVRDFYAQYDRDGLIIDVRRNRGGNIDSWIIEKLLRRAWAFWQPANGTAYSNMQSAFRGHLAVLADQLTYSDGETFAAGVKALKLGPVIGMRTSGAGVWLSDRNRLSDNGIARVAEFAQFDAQGRWLIESRGVAPDIEVDNLPHATALGGDAQLDAALSYLEDKLREQPVPPFKAAPLPPRPNTAYDGSR